MATIENMDNRFVGSFEKENVMAFENLDNEQGAPEGTPPPAGSGSRPFLVVAGILGAITLLALACIALYALVFLPQRRAVQANQVTRLNAQNTQVAQAITQTALAVIFTPTSTTTRVPPTSTRTPAAVVAVPTNTSVAAGGDPRTATVAALLTQAAGIQRTPTARTTATALPTTGFADEVGVPGMLALSVLLISVIFLARRLRTSGP
jgi:hypothetical protein